MEIIDDTKLARSWQELSWHDVRADVKKVNPELAAIIDSISPDKRHPFVKATFNFGDPILKSGKIQIKCHNDKERTQLNKLIGYNNVPLALLLNKASEIFLTENERVVPLKVLSPGMLFGTFETTDLLLDQNSTPVWDITAGCRSLFTLPKITETGSLNRLKNQFHLPTNLHVHSISDHWQLFKSIAQHKNFNQVWKSEILFFTHPWFKVKDNDSVWSDFNRYIFKQAWMQSRQSIAKATFAVYWQSLIKTITQRRIQPTPYLIDTLKHIMLIAIKEAPAFQPTTHNEEVVAPIKGIQDALLEVYLLKKYAPAIMHSMMPTKEIQHPFYYSLALPTLLEGSPSSKCSSSTIMLDLKNIKLLISSLAHSEYLSEEFLKNVHFDYFHVEDDKHQEILSSTEIPSFDKRFADFAYPDREFCSTSPFWRGSIMIS